MRSPDRSGFVAASGRFIDAASGNGLLQPGNIPYTWVRSTPGVYDLKFDGRWMVVAAVASGELSGGVTVRTANPGPGAVTLAGENNAGALTSTHVDFTLLLRNNAAPGL